ncbi:MAG: hypothetical protein JST04_07450 [Bdellovibrionales bacterium]|nr:hypothetical protein [Bdellovibrionales bacterium]
MRKRRKNIARSHEIGLIWSKRAPLGPYPLILVLDGLKASFNVGKIVRTANALGVREVFLVGIPPWDPVLARGALKATRTRTFAEMKDAIAALREEGYALYALHPRGEAAFGSVSFPEKTAFLVGHEEFGLSVDVADYPEITLIQVPQVGIVESLNVSVAASIAAYDYLRDRKLLGTAKPLVPAEKAPSPRAPRVRPLPVAPNLP